MKLTVDELLIIRTWHTLPAAVTKVAAFQTRGNRHPRAPSSNAIRLKAQTTRYEMKQQETVTASHAMGTPTEFLHSFRRFTQTWAA